MDDETEGLVREIARLVRSGGEPRLVPLGDDAHVLALPTDSGFDLREIEPLRKPFRTKPKRRTGLSELHDIDSFVAWVNRHKNDQSVLFFDSRPEKLSVTAIIDYNEAGPDGVGTARFGEHQAVYRFPVSRIWSAWEKIEKAGWMKQIDFAQMLEDRIGEIVVPPTDQATHPAERRLMERFRAIDPTGPKVAGPETLQALARGLEIHETSRLMNAESLHSGQRELRFSSEHRDAAGETLRVPTCFAVACPVFERDAAYLLPIRLRYRKQGENLLWSCTRYDVEAFREDAIKLAINRIVSGQWEERDGPEGTQRVEVAPGVGLPLFWGLAEGARQ